MNTWITRVFFVLLVVSVVMLTAACTPSGGTDITVEEGQTALDAIMNSMEACFDDCKTEEGSTSDLKSFTNSDHTLGLKASVSGYPETRIYIFNAYLESLTGYRLDGSCTVVWDGNDHNTCTLDVQLQGNGLPMRSVTASLTNHNGESEGEVIFNTYTKLGINEFKQNLFSH